MNQDEVEKCKQIATSAMAAGDVDKAVRFLQKAKRMNPEDASLDALLARAESGKTPSGTEAPPTESSGPRFRTGSSVPSAERSGAASASGSSAGRTRVNKEGKTYTAEQMQEVQRILRTKDYYAILGVDKHDGEDVIKKAYKKMALKLHPDKNKAPGAEEAFKKVSKVVQCLTDSEKKEVYDQYGDEENIPQMRQQRYQQDFMTPEDLFAHIFGGPSFSAAFHSHGHQRAEGDERDAANAQRAQLFQMLPIILLVMLTLASNFASRETGSRFSFTPNGQFQDERTTATLNVNYYVTTDFDDQYSEGTRALADFERQVEIYHVRNLHNDCDLQEKVAYRKLMMAKRHQNKAQVQEAKNHPKPACVDIEKIKRQHQNIYRSAVMGY